MLRFGAAHHEVIISSIAVNQPKGAYFYGGIKGWSLYQTALVAITVCNKGCVVYRAVNSELMGVLQEVYWLPIC